MSNSYKVSSGSYGGYPNYAYNGQEMSEYRQGSGINKSGSGNANYSGNSHQRNTSVSYNNSGMGVSSNGKNSSAAAAAAIDEDDEYDRGHWGSKAEFILSCIGFSVR